MEKKRILVANKFYYPRGGDCIVAMNLERLLKDKGHDVAVFAMDYSENIDSGWNKYYASQVEMTGGVLSKIHAFKRIMGYGDIKAAFNKILDDFKPDIVHLHNIHSYLSPVLAQLAKKRGCKVVWTLHDYKLVCPSYACLLNEKPCERCIGHSKTHVLKNRCMKGSLAASAMAWLEAQKWKRNKLEEVADAFICPSEFMASKMKKDGFNPEKLHVVCNHIDPEKLESMHNAATPSLDLLSAESRSRGEKIIKTPQLPNSVDLNNGDSKAIPNREDYYVYVGRLSPEKGVETLLDVASKLPFTLKIAGDGPMLDQLKQQYSENHNIEFCGRLDARQVAELLCKARFSVMPSECYDNNPLGVIESLCAGTPVVGARIGGIPELLDENNGMAFTSGDRNELAHAIKAAFEKKWDNNAIKDVAISDFSAEKHLRLIEEIYQ